MAHASNKLSAAATLRRVPLFSDVSKDEIELIASRVTRRHHEAGELICAEGERSDSLIIVESGSVRTLRMSAYGREQLIAIERAGAPLTEVPVLDHGTYPVTAIASSEVSILCLPGRDFRDLCRRQPELGLKVMKVLTRRLRHTLNLVQELSFATVRGRLAAYLVRLARETGHQTPRGTEFELPETNQKIGARIGTVRDLVSRNLGRLHADGLISIVHRTVTILNLPALEAEASKSA